MKKIKIFLLLLILILILPVFRISYSFTDNSNLNLTLDKPKNATAYAVGTNITIKWDYPSSVSSIGTYSVEIYVFQAPNWVNLTEVFYPKNSYSYTGSYGLYSYKIRMKYKYFFIEDYSEWVYLFAYVLKKPTGLKVNYDASLILLDPVSLNLILQWDPVDSLATNIQIWSRKPPFMWELRATLANTETKWTDTGVSPNTQYEYMIRVKGTDETHIQDDYSDYSDKVTILSLPETPTNLQVYADKKTIHIYWSHTGNCDGFKIYIKSGLLIWAWNLVDTLPKTTFSYIINAANYGAYTYKVAAYNSGGLSPSNPSGTAYVLSPPSGLSATALSSTSIKLSWNPVDSNATQIVIFRSEDGTSWTNYQTISSSLTTWTDTNCLPSKTYWYSLWAKRDKNNSDWSNKVSATTLPLGSPPASPSNLQGSAISCNQIDLSWQDNATDETNYIVERKIEGGSYSVRATLPANTTVYSDTGLSANTKYYYRVKAKNGFGDSGYSNEINLITPPCGTPPNAPTNLILTVVSSSQINLSWSDNSDNETGFKIERKMEGGSYSEIGEVGANVTSYSDSSLLPDTKYYYRVRAFNSFGYSIYSNEASAKTLPLGTPPNAPSNLNVSAISCDKVQLNWNDNSDNEDGFKIERKEGGGSFVLLTTVGPNITSYLDETTSENKNYTYKVTAFNEFGENSSSEKQITTPPCGTKPNAPSDLNLEALSPTQVKITFTDNSDNEDGFKIERKELGGIYSEIKTLSKDVTEFTDSVNPNTTYYYRVRAFNTYGFSDYSNEANITTPQIGIPPNPPTNLIASAVSCNEVSLIWVDNSNNEDGFKIERKVEGGTYNVIATLTSNSTTYSDKPLSGNTKYYYRVLAFNSYGSSTYSNEFMILTPPCGTKPNAPTNLFGEAISSTQISLSWKDNSDNEDGFILERKEEGGTYQIINTLPKDTNKYTDKNLIPDKTYYYRVKAFNSSGESDYSNEVKVKTVTEIEKIILRFYINKTTYYVNDEMRTMDVAPMILEGRTLLPIRYVAEALGADVGWEAKEEKVTINFKGIKIELWIGKNLATVNGEWKLIDPGNPNVKPITIPPGRTMLPIRFIAENLGCKVDWDPNLKEVKITYPGD